MLKTKYIRAPDRGVDNVRPPNVLTDRQWLSLAWTRGGHGKLEPLPGYVKKITSGDVPTTPIIMLTRFRKSDDLEYHFVGDETKLYRWDPSTAKLTSLSDSLAAFAQNMDTAWAFTAFLDKFYVNAVNQALYSGDGSSDFVAVGGDTFAARAIIGFKNHLLAAGKNGDPLKLFWAADGTTTFTATAANDAGDVPLKEFSDLPQRFMQIGPDICVLYGQKCTNVITFVGGDAVFAQSNVSKRIGSLGPHGVLDLGFNRHFVVGFGDFYIFNGLDFKSVGESIRDTFFNTDAHPNYLDRIRLLFDQITGLIYVFFVSRVMTQALGFYPDKMYIYDTIENLWYGPSTLLHYVTAVSELTGSFIVVIDSISDIIDIVGLLIDDVHAWTSIGATMAFGASNGQLYGFDKSLLTADGLDISREGVTGDKFITKGSISLTASGLEAESVDTNVYYITRIFYEVGDDDSTGTLTLEAAVREHLNDTITYTTVGTITLGTVDSNKGHFDVRLKPGRYIRFRITGTNRIALRDIGWDYYKGGKVRR